MMDARIRPMRAEDADAVADLTTQLGYPVEAEAERERIIDILHDPSDHAALVAVDDDDLAIGWIHVERLRHLGTDHEACLMGLVVDESHRSAGVGSALLAAAESWAEACGAVRVTVRSRVARERAHSFYQRHGYAIVKTSYVFRKALG